MNVRDGDRSFAALNEESTENERFGHGISQVGEIALRKLVWVIHDYFVDDGSVAERDNTDARLKRQILVKSQNKNIER